MSRAASGSSRVPSNLAANLAGSAWIAATQLAVVPYYLSRLGLEAYALIGLYLILQSAPQLLDFGFGTALNRRLARATTGTAEAREAAALARTLELAAWSAAALAAALVALAAPALATTWLRLDALSVADATAAIRALGLLFALQFPLYVYQSALNGAQRQVALAAVRAVAATLAAAGSVLALRFLAPTAATLFVTLAAVALAQALALRRLLAGVLGRVEPRAARSFPALTREREFAGGVAFVSITGFLLTQMDKVVLSRVLPLSEFGYYTLAASAATGLYLAIAPLYNALFPRFSELLGAGDRAHLTALYRTASRALAVLVLAPAGALAFHAHAALLAWTGDDATAVEAAPLLSLLLAGTAVNGLMHLPYALQLAAGWTGLGVRLHLFLLALGLPALLLLATRFGATGGAAVWVGLNLAYLALGAPLAHRRLLPGITSRWLLRDVGAPAAAAVASAAALAALVPAPGTRGGAALQLALALALAVSAALLCAGDARAWLRSLADDLGRRSRATR
jgi:O-antigen/teichoic acid export membrane protein